MPIGILQLEAGDVALERAERLGIAPPTKKTAER
jgi:hypothetical protein